ncbi:MAG: glycoside hydrolase family 5 protein [Candidatus Bathyarchaeia archaeon]
MSGWKTRKTSIGVVVIVLLAAVTALTFGTYGFFTLPSGPSSTSASNRTGLSTVLPRTLVRYSGLSLLRTNGMQIVDQYGNIVVLRGVDLTGYEYVPPTLSVYPHHSSDYATIASWGFNVVRLPISWENLEPRPGQYNDSYLQNLVDHDIEWAKEYGVYIVLDMHQVCWSSHFEFCNGSYSAGVPRWAVSSYPNNDAGEDAFLQDFFSGLGPNGTIPSASNPSMLTRFFAVWRHVASRYANETAIAAYDLLNEPPSTTPLSFYRNATEAVRAIDQHHICLWETDGPIEVPNVIYSPHYPQDSLTSYNATSLKVGVRQIVDFSRKWDVPVFIGEWGMQADSPGVVQYIQDGLSLFDSYSISSAWWDYASGDFTMDLFYGNGSARQILVQNLVRPFISELTSSITQTSTFTLSNGSITYSQMLNSTGPSQIQVSIPTGYSIANIHTSSAFPVRSQSTPDGRTLLLTFPSAASTVTVEYTSRPS